MLTALVLVCSMHAAPCTQDLARMVVRVPEPSAVPFMCLRNGQAYLAGSGLEVGAEEVVRVICVRERMMERAEAAPSGSRLLDRASPDGTGGRTP